MNVAGALEKIEQSGTVQQFAPCILSAVHLRISKSTKLPTIQMQLTFLRDTSWAIHPEMKLLIS